jgi:anti-sigma B factor antagonist
MIFEDKMMGEILTVKPLGRRIDASSSTNLKGHMVDWITEGKKHIVLDLSGVDFIDSSGLVAIVSALKMIGPGGDLVICGMSEAVMNLFRLTRMNRVFQIFPSREAAVHALSNLSKTG